MAISHVFSNQIADGTNTNIVRPSDWNSAHNQYYTLSGNTLGASTVSGTNVVFQGSGNISLSGTGRTIVIYGTGGGGGGGAALSAGTQSVSTGTVSFADSNGISFGMAGSNQITASHNGITTQSVQTQAAGNIAGTGFTTATTAGSVITGALGTNGLNLGIPAYLTAAVGGGGVAIGASTQTATSGTVIFSNSNGITFGLNNGTLTASAAAAPTSYVSNVNGSSGQISLNVGSSLSSSTAGSSITFGLASNITTALQSAGAYLTTAAQSSASNLSIAVAATNSTGGGTATLASSISFSNANGLTFYTSAGNAIVASYTVPTQSIQTQASGNIAGTGFTTATTAGTVITGALGTNGLNLGVPAYLTTQSIQTQASGNIAGTGFTTATTAGTVITGALGTDGLNLGVPAYLTAAAGGIMYANLSGNTSGNTTASGSTLNFSGINLTLSGTNNSQIAISAPATSSLVAGANITISTAGSTISIIGGAGGGVALGASTQTATSGTVNFVNSNGITFGMSGSSQITASHNGITTQTVQTQASGAIAGTGFFSTTTAGTAIVGTNNSNGLSLGVPAYLTTQSVQTQAAGNIAGTGFTTATTAGSVVTGALGTDGLNLGIPAYLTAAGSGGAVNFSAGATSNNLQTVVFSNSNGVSFGLNGSTITASVVPQYTLSGYNHYNDAIYSAGTIGQGSLIFDHIDLENPVQFNKYGVILLISNATNSTGSHTVSMSIGLYTQNGSTMSLLGSTSTSVAATLSGTAGSYSLYSGIKQVTIPYTTTLSRGEYFLGVISSSSSAGQNATFNQCRQSALNSNYNGLFGVSVATSNQLFLGAGVYSQTTTAFPNSIAFSQIRGTNADAFRPPIIIFQSDIA
jgi:hypothetical protein